MTALGVFVLDHAGEIEVDLLRYYNVDLRDYFTGAMSGRRLKLLLDALPVESRLSQKLAGAEDGPAWGVSDYLLAQLIDSLNVFSWLYGAGAGFKSNPLGSEPPEPIHRPITHAGPSATPEEIASFFGELRTISHGGS